MRKRWRKILAAITILASLMFGNSGRVYKCTEDTPLTSVVCVYQKGNGSTLYPRPFVNVFGIVMYTDGKTPRWEDVRNHDGEPGYPDA